MFGSSTQYLTRTNIWSDQLKEQLLDEHYAQKWVDYIDFPDGDTINIPSIGQFTATDFAEGQAVKYTALDTGNFTFTIDQYKSAATFIYSKYLQDSFYMSRVVSQFVPKMHRAISAQMEAKVLAVGPAAQTASDLNTLNGADHRFVASGTNATVVPQDFARAKYALEMANVPLTNLVAIVHPSVGYALETMTNLVNMSYNPMWEGIVTTGMTTGMRFVRNVYGFDVYVSHYLPVIGAETIDSVSVNSTGVANQFFSATQDILPFIGSIRQPPKVESSYNKDFQREEYVTTCRYGYASYRQDNFVTILSATDQVG